MFARYASVGASVLRKVCGSSEPVSRRMLEYGFFFAAGLILSMAVTSRPGGHPDEASHYPSAQYYASRFLPPHPADPANPRDPPPLHAESSRRTRGVSLHRAT